MKYLFGDGIDSVRRNQEIVMKGNLLGENKRERETVSVSTKTRFCLFKAHSFPLRNHSLLPTSFSLSMTTAYVTISGKPLCHPAHLPTRVTIARHSSIKYPLSLLLAQLQPGTLFLSLATSILTSTDPFSLA